MSVIDVTLALAVVVVPGGHVRQRSGLADRTSCADMAGSVSLAYILQYFDSLFFFLLSVGLVRYLSLRFGVCARAWPTVSFTLPS